MWSRVLADRSFDRQTDERSVPGAPGASRTVRGNGWPALYPVVPDAYEEAGPYITLATAVGFLGTFLL